ncbi:hypothetical protein [Novosphingobium profundi]|nr:hypothetical protein [Novosphingobium profundi]
MLASHPSSYSTHDGVLGQTLVTTSTPIDAGSEIRAPNLARRGS